MEWWGYIVCVVCLLVGAIAGYFIARKIFEKQLEKNPPINEDMVRAMYLQMGRKPSEAQIKAVVNSANAAKNKGKK